MRTIYPMMPKAVDELPVGSDWSYEIKYDGYRALAVKDARGVRLLSRTQHDLTRHFPRIAGDLARLSARQVVLDGELVALDAQGRPSFQALQSWHRRLREGNGFALAYYVFDLLELDGESWMSRPLSERRRRLVPLVRGDTLLRSRPLPGRPAVIERQIRAFGLEGIVAKRRQSRYRPGERSRDWVKVRFSPRDSFVVGGYKPNGNTFDALLVGQYQEGELRYAGEVRAGFTDESRTALLDAIAHDQTNGRGLPVVQATRRRTREGDRQRRVFQMPGLRSRVVLATAQAHACAFVNLPHHRPYRRHHPFDHRIGPEDMTGIRWVRPTVVIEVSYLEWTRHGLLRDGRFLGVREDTAVHTVARETVTRQEVL